MKHSLGPYTPAGRSTFAPINEHALPIMAPLFMPDPDPNPNPNPNPDPAAEIERWKNEAKKAFQDRDAAKARAKELEGKLPNEEQLTKWQELEKQAEQLEEDRKKKAGEFDAWRTQIAEKHGKELAAERAKIAAETDAKAAAVKDLHNTLIGLSFAGASELFGDNGKTVLTPEIAQSYFGKHVQVKDENGVRAIVVTDANGNELIDSKSGKPMAFEKAIGELIDALPNKDRILRGSGKAGSGNTGGGKGSGPVDLATLARKAASGDKDAIAQLKQQRPGTGIVMGEAYS